MRSNGSLLRVGGCGGLLGIRDTDVVGDLRNLAEVPVDGVECRLSERACPVAEQLGGYRKRRRRHRAGVRQSLDGGVVRCLGTASDRIGDVHDVVAVLQRLDGREREADLRVETADDQSLTSGRLYRFAERLVL